MRQKPKRSYKSAHSADNGSSAESEDIKSPVTETVVREKAVLLLGRREHGRLELRQKLIQREYPVHLVDKVLDRLAERGLQCDARFAESYTRMRVDRGFGMNKIRADLQARRLTSDVIESAIADNGADWEHNAHSALLKRFGAPFHVGEIVEKDFESAEQSDDVSDILAGRAKMQRFLQSRGYTSSQIYAAIKRIGQPAR